MTDSSMPTSISRFRSAVPQLASALKAFQNSDSRFRVLIQIPPLSGIPETPKDEPPKTLFILDSSFNPPSVAHQRLAMSSLHKSASDPFPKPHRMLLLFSTMNADKAPSAAAFEQRLTLMHVFAEDLLAKLRAEAEEYSMVGVDVGVTTAPYYTDKSKAIEDEGLEWFPSQPRHIHLVGFDTLTRVFAARYYPKFDPPFSALNPFFNAGYRLRVTLRPDDQYGSVEDQKAFLARLENGEMEEDGGKQEWAMQVELVPPNPQVGVSSTKIRKAAKRGDWEEVGQLCTPGVAEYVRSEKLYEDDDRGAKMA